MDLNVFVDNKMGSLVPITGTDPFLGEWSHRAFVPAPLPKETPALTNRTYLAVSNTRAALSALDNTARQLPNPQLFRNPALRREAQSTSALEGTYAPLESVLTADEETQRSPEMIEIMNYVTMASFGFNHVLQKRPFSVSFLNNLQGLLMQRGPLENESGDIRSTQVVIGRRSNATAGGFPVHGSRFIPPPPGIDLEAALRDLTDWMNTDHKKEIDPVVAAAMAHYQFETLHPYRDGNGRLGRFLIVSQLLRDDVLSEPTLTVSPWFEARRVEYYDRLLAVSTDGNWDSFIRFFAQGIEAAATQTLHHMQSLIAVQHELKEVLRTHKVRADSAYQLVDFAIGNPSFTIRKAQNSLSLSYQGVRRIINILVDLGLLARVQLSGSDRFFAPRVLSVLMG
ncbi:Fic family protein [Timonella sp. A28]|uniref:Fic family protein n=1 Tax=Timonella sp. A28 TaxID=3442640 RepID=UPI003EB9FD22